jgi:hypothetical protein
MHHHNDWYGHVRLLARYAGLPTSGAVPRLWGYLQHGWNVHNGFGANTPVTPGMPRLVWSEAARRRGWAEGESGYHVIGAPWTYLLRMVPPAGNAPRAGTIFYPFHGFEQQQVTGDHRALAGRIAATEAGPVTVCLYWMDYQRRRIRRPYQQRGFRIICHGYRGDKNRPGDADFLYRQLAELRRHARVASNRLSTALLYGASVGCEIGVYGPEMTIQNPPAVYGGNDRIRRLWPRLHQERVPAVLAAAFAEQELGMDHTLGPAELAEVCGWSPWLGGAHQPALAGGDTGGAS